MLEIKKQFFCKTANVGLIKNEKPGEHGMATPWGVLITSCTTGIGQQMLTYDNYNKAIKVYNLLKALTEGHETNQIQKS